MKFLFHLTFALGLAAASLPAYSAISCSLTPNPSQVNLTYDGTTQTATGTLNMTCTRGLFDGRPDIWIGMDQVASGRNAMQEAGHTLNYTVYHNTTNAGIWLNTGGVTPGSSSNGAIVDPLDFPLLVFTKSESYRFFLRVPGVGTRPAGDYQDSIPITLRLNNQSGTVLVNTTLNVSINVPKSCRFSTPPPAIGITYPAFSPTAVTGRSDFAVTCTLGTSYELLLDATRSVVPNVQLAYSLSLSAVGGSGTAAAQPYRINISVDPGQAGRCSGSTCTGQDYRTLTIRY